MAASVRRGVAVALTGATVAAGALLLAYPHLPDMVVKHGSISHPDAWETKQGWLAFTVPFCTLFPLGMLGFVALVSQYREGFHTNDPQAQAYWTSDEHWPEAHAILLDAMGWFTAAMSVLMAATFVLTGGGRAWGIGDVVAFLPVAGLLATVGWLTVHLLRAYRLPGRSGAPGHG